MRFDVLTIFPELLISPLREGIIRIARERDLAGIHCHDIRSFATDKHHMVDDRPFGGGEGMVLKAEPLAACLEAVRDLEENPGRVILLSPRGKTLTQQKVSELARESRLILVCGRYEGIDERFCSHHVDEEISIGDYILTGGELGAMVIIDSVIRLLPGVLGCGDSAGNDTFSRNLLKHPQYTRPRVFEGDEVPPVLLSGDHRAINEYRFVESVRITLERRPELIEGVEFTTAEKKILRKTGLEKDIRQVLARNQQNVAI